METTIVLGAIFIVGIVVGIVIFTFLGKSEKAKEQTMQKPALDPLEAEAKEHLKNIN